MTWWREKSKLAEPTFEAFPPPPNYDPSVHSFSSALFFLITLSKPVSFARKGLVMWKISFSFYYYYYYFLCTGEDTSSSHSVTSNSSRNLK